MRPRKSGPEDITPAFVRAMVDALKLRGNAVVCLECAKRTSDFLCVSCGHCADPAAWRETNETTYEGPYCETCIDLLKKPGIHEKPPCPFRGK